MLLRALLLTMVSAGLAACGNFKTQAVDLTAVAPSKEVAGLPFTLNKPQFTITRVPGGANGPDRFTLTPAYVPDPKMRFAVSIHPSVLSSVDWTLSWDEAGSLTDSNARFTDQTVAVLASTAKLGLSLGLFDKNVPDERSAVSLIDGRLERNFKATLPLIFADRANGLIRASPSDVKDLGSTWSQLKPRLDILAEQGRVASFTYQNARERIVLLTALYLSLNEPQFNAKDLKANKVLASKNVNEADQWPYAQQIVDAYEALDLAKINAIKAAAIKTKSRAEADLRQVDALKEEFERNKLIITQQLIIGLADDAAKMLKAVPNDRLFAIAKLPIDSWSARRITELNSEIAARQLAIRAESQAVDLASPGNLERDDQQLRSLLRRKAAVLGLLDVHDQAETLRRVAMTDPKTFKDAQSMRADMLKRLADTEAALVIAATTPKPDDSVIAETLQASANDKPDDRWVKDRVRGRPTYVVVLQPVAGSKPAVPSTTPQ